MRTTLLHLKNIEIQIYVHDDSSLVKFYGLNIKFSPPPKTHTHTHTHKKKKTTTKKQKNPTKINKYMYGELLIYIQMPQDKKSTWIYIWTENISNTFLTYPSFLTCLTITQKTEYLWWTCYLKFHCINSVIVEHVAWTEKFSSLPWWQR